MSFRVSKGHCFGLLGVNGAGKTATFQMMTGENLITSGDVSICGSAVSTNNWRDATKNIGYCPQFDAVVGLSFLPEIFMVIFLMIYFNF